MHLFSVAAFQCPEEAMAWWFAMGFRAARFEDETGPSGLPAAPDVLLTFEPFVGWWDELLNSLPRCFVLRQEEQQARVPARVAEIYEIVTVRVGRHEWMLGWKTMEAVKLPEALCAATEHDAVSLIAEAVYRMLLNDTFRETAEWCGHMSSVVRPL